MRLGIQGWFVATARRMLVKHADQRRSPEILRVLALVTQSYRVRVLIGVQIARQFLIGISRNMVKVLEKCILDEILVRIKLFIYIK